MVKEKKAPRPEEVRDFYTESLSRMPFKMPLRQSSRIFSVIPDIAGRTSPATEMVIHPRT